MTRSNSCSQDTADSSPRPISRVKLAVALVLGTCTVVNGCTCQRKPPMSAFSRAMMNAPDEIDHEHVKTCTIRIGDQTGNLLTGAAGAGDTASAEAASSDTVSSDGVATTETDALPHFVLKQGEEVEWFPDVTAYFPDNQYAGVMWGSVSMAFRPAGAPDSAWDEVYGDLDRWFCGLSGLHGTATVGTKIGTRTVYMEPGEYDARVYADFGALNDDRHPLLLIGKARVTVIPGDASAAKSDSTAPED